MSARAGHSWGAARPMGRFLC